MSNASILIIDDNPMNVKLVQTLLEHAHYEVQVATNAEDALDLLQSWHPRLILMDIQLPAMDGLELTRRLKADPATQDILIVALTAYAMKGDAERITEAGCDGYIAKPIDILEFLISVGHYLSPQTEIDLASLFAEPGPYPAL
jgi:two-component system, cell cycle response regulator DivK